MLKLLTSLTEQPADNCVILTYNADLLFFEYLVFNPLYAMGCRNTIVMCDPNQYEQSIQAAAQLKYAGQRYLLVPALTSSYGAFHSKLILLTSREGGRLFVTSGNLSRAGYTHNLEVATIFDYVAKKADSTAWHACSWALRTAQEIVTRSSCDSLVQSGMEQIWGTTPWLRAEPENSELSRVWLCDNLNNSLLDKLHDLFLEHDGSNVDSVTIVSPYFDRGAVAFNAVLDRFKPEQLRVYMESLDSGIDPSALRSVLASHTVDFAMGRIDLDSRRLHAKSLLLQTKNGVWAISGSANFSAPALLNSAATGNTEAVVVRYEQNPEHFQEWIASFTACSHPLTLDSLPEPRPSGLDSEVKPPPIRLRSATIEAQELTLRIDKLLPDNANLTIYLQHEHTEAIVVDEWAPLDESSLIIELPSDLTAKLARPSLMALGFESPSLSGRTNQVLIHNIDSLTRHTRPVSRKSRPSIPHGLVPEYLEHCVQIIEMLHDLLATNIEQLDCHGGRSAQLRRQDEQEQHMAIEEEGEYDPEDHFVPELIRRSGTRIDGSDLYMDYYDRLTYQDLLRAALAAVFHPSPADTTVPAGPEGDPEVPQQVPHDPDSVAAGVLARIESGTGRLVANFLQGLQNEEYMVEVPPHYLNELYVIILRFISELRRQDILAKDLFVQHSLALLSGYWGRPNQNGAWSFLAERLSDDEVEAEDQRLRLSVQTWFHTYILAKQLALGTGRQVYELAAWMRYFAIIRGKANILATLSDEEFAHLWSYGAPHSIKRICAADVVNVIQETSRMYDEESLLDAIRSWGETKATTLLRSIAGTSKVPTLDVRLPLSMDDFDRCLRAFLLFVRWPQYKPLAWANFATNNPAMRDSDLESVRFFYRGEESCLTFAVRLDSGEFVTVEDKLLSRKDIETVTTIRDLPSLPSYHS